MRRHRGVLGLVIVLCAIGATSASAQDPGRRPGRAPFSARTANEPGRPGSLELTIGGELLFPESLGSTTATLLQNNTGSSPFNYFTTTATRQTAPAFRADIGYNITRVLAVQGGFLVGRGNLKGTVANDTENAGTFALGGRMTQYVFDATVLAHLRNMAFSGGAGVPYLEAGAGYLRQLQEGNFAAETGQLYHVGGGIRFIVSRQRNRRISAYGLRVGARAYVQNKGYSIGSSQRVYGAITGGLLMMF